MIASSTQVIIWFIKYKYFVIFPIATIEWPIISIIAGFIVSLGYMNFFLVYLILIISDIIGDILYYFLGKYYGIKLVNKYWHKIGLTQDKLEKLDISFEKNTWKILFIAKITHTFGMWVLIISGILKVKLSKFIFFNFIPNLLKSFILLYIWYVFGKYYKEIDSYLYYYILVTFVVFILILVKYIKSSKNIIFYIDQKWE